MTLWPSFSASVTWPIGSVQNAPIAKALNAPTATAAACARSQPGRPESHQITMAAVA